MAAKGAEAPPRFGVAIVGATPLARSVREALLERRFPYSEVRLLGVGGAEVPLTEFNGEPRVLEKAEPGALRGVHLAFFCEDPATGGAYRAWTEQSGFLGIDLTGNAPASDAPPLAHGGLHDGPLTPKHGWLAAPHPLTHLLVSLLAPIDRRVRLTAVRGLVLRPAADYGQAGLDELYQQSVSLFNFSSPPDQVFGRQLAFNLIPADLLDGARPMGPLVAAQLAELLGRPGLPVSVFLAAAPVFHAHSVALHLEFEGRPTEAALLELLRASGDLRVDAQRLTAVEVADEIQPHVGLIRCDPDQRGAWLWAVADRVAAAAARGAVRLAERLLGVTPSAPPAGRRKPGAATGAGRAPA